MRRKSLPLLRDLIEERTGNHYGDEALDLLGDKLEGRLAELGMVTFLDYYYLLRYDQDGEREWEYVETAVTVNETYFWREPEALQVAARHVLPKMLQSRSRPVRIWHAACASGEEPLSMVMALQEAGLLDSGRIEIVATDIDSSVLERARRGVFRERSFRNLPPGLRNKYFREAAPGQWEFEPRLLARVQFRQMNLVGPFSMEEIDLIFCRNVLIYFREKTIVELARRMRDVLAADGFLFLGATESLLRFRTPFHFVDLHGVVAYGA